MNQKGVSGIITVVILIAIVLALMGIVWNVVLPMVNDSLNRAGACSPELLEKIEFNREYTCYSDPEPANPGDEKIRIMVELGDVEIDELKIYGTNGETSKTISLPSQPQDPDTGETYEIDVSEFGIINEKPTQIKLIPVVGGEQCQAVDSLTNIKNCA